MFFHFRLQLFSIPFRSRGTKMFLRFIAYQTVKNIIVILYEIKEPRFNIEIYMETLIYLILIDIE